ncbi:TPA: hypothetical protein ACPT0V_005067, partial [Escherichia coli]
MNPVPWLQMTNMISYQGLVRTFPCAQDISQQSAMGKKNDCLVIFDSGNGDLKENKIFFA